MIEVPDVFSTEKKGMKKTKRQTKKNTGDPVTVQTLGLPSLPILPWRGKA